MARLMFPLIFLCYLAGLPLHADTRLDKIQLRDADLAGESAVVWIYFVDKGNQQTPLGKMIPLTDRCQQRRNIRGGPADIEFLDREVNPHYVESIRPYTLKIRHQSRWLNAVSAEVSTGDLANLAQLPEVEKITSVVTYRRQPEPVVDIPPLYKPHDDNPPFYGDSYFQLAKIHVTDLHARGLTGAGVTILLLDTGFRISHEVFNQADIDSTWDFINDDVDVQDNDSVPSQQSHGTSTLSVIGGYTPGEVIGAAYEATFLLGKTEQYGPEIQIEEDDWVAGIEWGEALGADVVSSSLGYTDWYDFEDMDGNTAVTTVAADIAASLGVIVCNSQGNAPRAPFVVAPADGDSVIAAGGVDRSGPWAGSVHGPAADGRIKPDVCALASGVHVATAPSGYGFSSGTSFACPLVAGAVALLLEEHPDWEYGDLYYALTSTASNANTPDNIIGYGVVNAAAANGTEIVQVSRLIAAPNPCSHAVTFQFPVDAFGTANIRIYTVAGEEVVRLSQQVPGSRSASLTWDLRNHDGEEVADGVYIVYVTAPGISETTKILKVRQ